MKDFLGFKCHDYGISVSLIFCLGRETTEKQHSMTDKILKTIPTSQNIEKFC